MADSRRIGVFGAGWVGLVTGGCLAELGHEVIVRDVMPERIEALRAGRLPFHEPDLPDVLERNRDRIRYTLDAGDRIPIEARAADEVLQITGRADDGTAARVAIATQGTPTINFAFDVTPARLVSCYVTERGIANDAQSLHRLHHGGGRGS